jgi:DNA-binding NarL/FixJ family response regulator
MPTRPRLIIADDHPLMIEGLEKLLGRKYKVVGVAHSGAALLELLKHLEADCLLLDLSMPGGQGGLELVPEIRRLRPDMKTIIVTQYVGGVVADAALQAGAHGFVPKDSGSEELIEAITAVLAGDLYVSPRIPRPTRMTASDHPRLAGLTPRQLEILRFIARGMSTANIAAELGLTQSAVEFHRTGILRELGIANSRELITWAVDHKELMNA